MAYRDQRVGLQLTIQELQWFFTQIPILKKEIKEEEALLEWVENFLHLGLSSLHHRLRSLYFQAVPLTRVRGNLTFQVTYSRSPI